MTDWGVHFRPPLGLSTSIAVITIAMVITAWLDLVWPNKTARPGARPWAWLRLGALGTLAWVLAGPQIQREELQEVGRSIPVLFLADTSASMAQQDVPQHGMTSGSSGTADQQMITRWDAIVRHWFDPAFLRRLRDHHLDVRLYGFDGTVHPMTFDDARRMGQPDGNHTHLYRAMDRLANDIWQEPVGNQRQPPGLVVLLSDGHDSQYTADPGELARLPWPVITVPVGATSGVGDVAVSAWAQSDVLFENQPTWIEVDITQRGFDGQRVRVQLFHEDRLVESKEIDFDHRPVVHTRFRVVPPFVRQRPKMLHAYRVEAQRVPSGDDPALSNVDDTEPFTDNNSQYVFIKVSRDQIKVAMFEAQPYWDTRFLARVLEDDPQVELYAVYRIGHNRFLKRHERSAAEVSLDTESTGPSEQDWLTRTWLNQFDVVILGRGAGHFFADDHAQLLVDYVVQQGGAVILARGQAFDDTTDTSRRAARIFSEIEPVRWGSSVWRHLKLTLARAGHTDPLTRFEPLGQTEVILSQLPGMIAATDIQGEKAASVVLLRQTPMGTNQTQTTQDRSVTNVMAAVTYQNVGHGRVFAVLGDGLWRWAFLPNRVRTYDSVYRLFWSRAIRWLAIGGPFLPGQWVSMNQSTLVAKPGESVTVTATARFVKPRMFDPKLKIIWPDGQTQNRTLTTVPGSRSPHHTTTFEPDQSGVYELELSYRDADGQSRRIVGHLAVHDRSVERLDPSARPDLLAQISQATGGQRVGVERPDDLLKIVQARGQSQRSAPGHRYVFDRIAVFGLITCLFGLDWFWRRARGIL